MRVKEFQDMVGGKHAVIMVCQVDGSMHQGIPYAKGKQLNVDLVTANALYKQLYNLAGGGEGRRWIPSESNVTDHEKSLMNTHFEKLHKREIGEEPVKVGEAPEKLITSKK